MRSRGVATCGQVLTFRGPRYVVQAVAAARTSEDVFWTR